MLKSHVILDISSDQRTNGTNNNFQASMFKAIEFNKLNKGRKYSVRLEDIIFPTSFHQINDSYHTFSVEEDNGVTQNIVTFNVTNGNYNATELAAELATKLNANSAQGNTYVVAFDVITGLITISYSGGASTTVTVQSQATSTINPFLGYGQVGSSDTTAIAPGGTASPGQVNMTVRDRINIETNISAHNHYTKDRQLNVGASVEISEERGDKIFKNNHDGVMIRYENATKFTTIRVNIKDRFNNDVDLLNVPYSFRLVFYEIE